MIAGNLEYLMSSLPYLSFEDSPEECNRVVSTLERYAAPGEGKKGTLHIFEQEARKFLDPKKARILEEIDLGHIHTEQFRKGGNTVLSSFSKYVYDLKAGIRKLRTARKSGMDPSAGRKPPIPLTPGTPLDEEIQLMRWQWEQLEELSIGHYADFGALCIYKLKLLLLLRWWSFDRKQGLETFLRITKTEG